MKENYFSEKVNSRTTEELVSIGLSKGERAELFVLAALWELERRKCLTPELQVRLQELETWNQARSRKAEYSSTFIPSDLPESIKISAYLLYSAVALELIQIFVFGKLTTIGFKSFVLPVGIFTFLTALFIHQGKKWANYVLYFLLFFSTLIFILTIRRAGIIEISQQILKVLALYFIFRKESRKWFARKNRSS